MLLRRPICGILPPGGWLGSDLAFLGLLGGPR